MGAQLKVPPENDLAIARWQRLEGIVQHWPEFFPGTFIFRAVWTVSDGQFTLASPELGSPVIQNDVPRGLETPA